MNDDCLFPRRLTRSVRILVSHNMRTNDASIRLRRTHFYDILMNELQRHARHVELFLSRHECDSLTRKLKILTPSSPGSSAAETLDEVVLA